MRVLLEAEEEEGAAMLEVAEEAAEEVGEQQDEEAQEDEVSIVREGEISEFDNESCKFLTAEEELL